LIDSDFCHNDIDDNTIFIDYVNSKIPKKIVNTARIWISNKGEWTGKKLRYYVKGNAFVSRMKKSEVEEGKWWGRY
jgi:DNA-3-methyladenine glycosylase